MGQADKRGGYLAAQGVASNIDSHLRVALQLAKDRDHQFLVYLVDMAVAENATGAAEPLSAPQKPLKLDLFTG